MTSPPAERPNGEGVTQSAPPFSHKYGDELEELLAAIDFMGGGFTVRPRGESTVLWPESRACVFGAGRSSWTRRGLEMFTGFGWVALTVTKVPPLARERYNQRVIGLSATGTAEITVRP